MFLKRYIGASTTNSKRYIDERSLDFIEGPEMVVKSQRPSEDFIADAFFTIFRFYIFVLLLGCVFLYSYSFVFFSILLLFIFLSFFNFDLK